MKHCTLPRVSAERGQCSMLGQARVKIYPRAWASSLQAVQRCLRVRLQEQGLQRLCSCVPHTERQKANRTNTCRPELGPALPPCQGGCVQEPGSSLPTGTALPPPCEPGRAPLPALLRPRRGQPLSPSAPHGPRSAEGGTEGGTGRPRRPSPARRSPGRRDGSGSGFVPSRLCGEQRSVPAASPPRLLGTQVRAARGSGRAGAGAGRTGAAAASRGGTGGVLARQRRHPAGLRRIRDRLALDPPGIPRASPEDPAAGADTSVSPGRVLGLSGACPRWFGDSKERVRCPVGKHSAVNALLCLLSPELRVKLVRPRRSKALRFC